MFHVKLSERENEKSANKVVVSHFFPSFFDNSNSEQQWKKKFFFHEIPFRNSFFYILSFMKFEVKAIYLLWLRGLYEF